MELESSDELWAKSMPQRDAMDGSGAERGREKGEKQDEARTKPSCRRPCGIFSGCQSIESRKRSQ